MGRCACGVGYDFAQLCCFQWRRAAEKLLKRITLAAAKQLPLRRARAGCAFGVVFGGGPGEGAAPPERELLTAA
eukprot:5454000-Alexandrium_andersonii.AAC.1